MVWCGRAMVTWLAAGMLWAAPPLTTIQDVLYKADGGLFNGLLFIEWQGFEAPDGSNIATERLTVRIVNGVLRVQLTPTTTASPRAYYRVRYTSNGRVQFEETWAVPPSARPLRVREVRVASGAAQGELIGISDVAGLAEALEARAAKGASYLPGRAVFINGSGELEAVAGNPYDCVRVDGSSGPCGSAAGGGYGGTFVDAETPAGVVDGSNTMFTLSIAPAPESGLSLYRNGLLQKQGLDYTLSGSVITFAAGAVPQPGDVLTANYRVSPVGGAAGQAEVLCSATGRSTSEATWTELGSCTIPGNVLGPGDRVEIRFDYSHQGTASGFAIAVQWGGTTLETRDAHAGVSLMSGRAEAAVRTAGVQWSTQSWGAALSLSTNAGLASDPLGAPLAVKLLGRMSGAGSDSVTLESYTVVRYPARVAP